MLTRGRPRRRAKQAEPFAAPEDSAVVASLKYVSDQSPGITRRRAGRGFAFTAPDGTPVRDAATLKRIRSLVIPPAWTAIWICPSPDGHIQATGRDARNRKQYRYHPRWTKVRDETKYERLKLFGEALPKIREQLRTDLNRRGLPKEKVLAAVVRLLETTKIRVGNDEYAKQNKSFGLTTFRNRHVEIDGNAIQFHFRGKSGKMHLVELNDARLAKMVQQCRDLPGQQLFQYLDDDGVPQAISSTDVNEYLRTIAGQDFTAKDFRTWAGTLLAIEQLEVAAPDGEEALAKSALVAAVKSVSEQLGNTPAVCRKCYIHPVVLATYQQPALLEVWRAERAGSGVAAEGLSSEEGALLRFLGRTDLPAAA